MGRRVVSVICVAIWTVTARGSLPLGIIIVKALKPMRSRRNLTPLSICSALMKGTAASLKTAAQWRDTATENPKAALTAITAVNTLLEQTPITTHTLCG